ncbi:LytR/AlgR family response regulator transcription factor [Parablautia muri]|uniref:Stage 0 sporulation protein A homolog n=1 Tax=Parablautia muri TaxID=2320879 RepID=A0A9X5BH39_9FIRM|nr:LytTR family DNA-binding domain-containing protein [Parablautia muri]NBJ93991.1 DNA-binding response regulator [Parablautia muri]
MLRIAVCDEEKSMGEYLRQLIERGIADRKDCRVEVFSSGEELLKKGKEFDIYFLDIDLKGMSGIDMARSLRQESEAIIVFVTALKEYVFDAFDVQAFQYLLKPIDEEKFFRVLEQAIAECRPEKCSEPLVVRVKGLYRNIPKESIFYAENEGRKIVLHLKEEQISYYAKMCELEEMLGDDFFRCHRGYLVNLNAVQGYDTGNIQIKNGETILMAKQKYSSFVDVYMEFLRRKQQ